MALPKWLKRYLPVNPLENPATSLSNPANWLWPAMGAVSSTSGVSVTPETALETVSVLSAVKLLSGTVAALPLLTYQETGSGKERATEHPAFKVLKEKANRELSSFNWREVLVSHVLLYGNGYAEIERSNNGDVLGLWPIYPTQVRLVRVNGAKVYLVTVQGQQVPLRAEDMLHVQGHSLDGQLGLPTSYLAREALGLAKATEQYGASFFGNGAQPGGVLTVDGVLNQQQRENIKASWEAAQKGLTNAQRVAVLEASMKYQQMGIAPEHAQFIDSRRFSVDEVARLFNIPPYLLGSTTNATYASVEAQQQDFVDRAVTPLCRRIEAELKLKLFDGTDYFAEFQLNGLLRGDSQARAQWYTALRNLGVLSVNEIRALENMNSLGAEGDTRLSPLNMGPLGDSTGSTNDQ